ncbi:MAG: hypothetical protein KGL46_14215 [Hyphomicrobiales bacterium]|nr:hypothetical protein [Hyphomicrobiales bacterium]
MIVVDAEAADIAHVVANMRAADAREVFAARFDDDPYGLAADMVAARARCIGFLAMRADDGEPVALLAAALTTPTVADVLMIATDRWPDIAFAATRFAVRRAIPCYLDTNVARAECRAWEGNAVACRWLEALGFSQEGLLRRYGRAGENYRLYARLNPG